jgi:N-acetylmuramoyl-L-alanine amidase
MRPKGVSRALVREREAIRGRTGSIEGQPIAIDPGYGGAPSTGPGQTTYEIAAVLADDLSAMGAKPMLLRGRDDDPTATDRARTANEMGAVLCLSLQLGEGAPAASGPTCAYFGSRSSHSPAGRHLAELILQELEAELGLSGGLRRLTSIMLRETRMPAVQVESLHATNPREREMLADPQAAKRIGRAVAAGTRRWFRS